MKISSECQNCGAATEKQGAKYCNPCIDRLNQLEAEDGDRIDAPFQPLYQDDDFSFTER